jgi:hypothetical protein
LCPRRQLQVAGTIDAGAERERYARGRRLVDGALQGARLIVGAAGAHAEMARIDAERRAWSRSGATGGERIGRRQPLRRKQAVATGEGHA